MPKEKPQFWNPQPLTKHEADDILATRDPERMVECLLALAFHESDTAYVWRKISQHIDNADPAVRGIAVLCIGHMARIHGHVAEDWARSAIDKALADPDDFVRGHAESAADDVQIFIDARTDL